MWLIRRLPFLLRLYLLLTANISVLVESLPVPTKGNLADKYKNNEKIFKESDLTADISPDNNTITDDMPEDYKECVNKGKAENPFKEDSDCGVNWDLITCWPITKPNTTVEKSCFVELNGVGYTPTGFARRFCNKHGKWTRTDYSECQEIDPFVYDSKSVIFRDGYILSAGSTFSGLMLSFKYASKISNKAGSMVHRHALFSYFMQTIIWLKLYYTDPEETSDAMMAALEIAYTFSFMANFLWIFLEGFCIYQSIENPLRYNSENVSWKPKMILFGWGGSALITAIWAIVKYVFIVPYSNEVNTFWTTRTAADWVFKVPIFLGLIANTYVFIRVLSIVWRTSTIRRSEQRKILSTIIVFFALLGTPFSMFLIVPYDRNFLYLLIIRDIMFSTMGFFVTLVYVFVIPDIRNAVKESVRKCRTRRRARSEIRTRATTSAFEMASLSGHEGGRRLRRTYSTSSIYMGPPKRSEFENEIQETTFQTAQQEVQVEVHTFNEDQIQIHPRVHRVSINNGIITNSIEREDEITVVISSTEEDGIQTTAV